MGRVSWADNSHEGKIIRQLVDKIMKQAKKSEDLDTLIKALNAISTASNSKANLSRIEKIDVKLDEVKRLLKEVMPKKIIGNLIDFRELPGAEETGDREDKDTTGTQAKDNS